MLASNGYTDTSMGGGTKLMRLHEWGCAGVLTDGRLRDFDELARYDFAAYCSGEATHWGGDRVTPFQANVPVVLDGAGVLPGSYMFADSSGAVVIPDRQVEEVLAEARKIEAADAASRDRSPASGFANDEFKPPGPAQPGEQPEDQVAAAVAEQVVATSTSAGCGRPHRVGSRAVGGEAVKLVIRMLRGEGERCSGGAVPRRGRGCR